MKQIEKITNILKEEEQFIKEIEEFLEQDFILFYNNLEKKIIEYIKQKNENIEKQTDELRKSYMFVYSIYIDYLEYFLYIEPQYKKFTKTEELIYYYFNVSNTIFEKCWSDILKKGTNLKDNDRFSVIIEECYKNELKEMIEKYTAQFIESCIKKHIE